MKNYPLSNFSSQFKRIAAAFMACFCLAASAQNPVVQTWFTTDPAPLSVGDKVYVYVGHDEDKADFFWMYEWRVYSSSDMVNWTDHGSLLNLSSFSWADDRAWAAQTIERNGVYYAKLNQDMISIDGEVKNLPMTEEAFGGPSMREREKGKEYKDSYVEGPWIMKKNIFPVDKKGKKAKKAVPQYYLLYAAGGVPEHISYSTAPSPEGPWTYRGPIMPLEDTKSFTNHCGVVEHKGHNYFFYHTGKLPGGGGFGRSMAIEEFQYNPDGTFPIIHHTDQGVSPIGTLNPFQRTEAETIAWCEGLKTENNQKTGVYVNEISNGDYIKVREVDFASRQPKSFTVSAASALQGGNIEVHLDSLKGQKIAQVKIPYTGGWEEWQQFRADVTGTVSGKHDVFFSFTGYKGMKLFTFDWWRFE